MNEPMYEINIGTSCFRSKKKLYMSEFEDYTVVADFIVEDYKDLFPLELKLLLNPNWFYHLHVPPLRIQRNHLQMRVIGGSILAYQFSDDLSISGNNVVYFGFLPTINKRFDDAFNQIINQNDDESLNSKPVFDEPDKHKCLGSAQKVWPRKLYVRLDRVADCACGEDCLCVKVYTRDKKYQNFCLKTIDWSKIYVFMGDFDEKCKEGSKVSRTCIICANCFPCSQRIDYCKSHKNCKHTVGAVKGSKLFAAEFKKCKTN